jgi:hypothetical protein
MVRHKEHRETHDAPSFALHATWSGGMRTTAWDRLWRMILGDLGPPPAGGPQPQPESEGDDA